VHARVRVNDLRQLANIERKGSVREGLLHRAVLEPPEVPATLGARAVGLGAREARKVSARGQRHSVGSENPGG
jgi:hypothetical protein